jgi:hypothetical protein
MRQYNMDINSLNALNNTINTINTINNINTLNQNIIQAPQSHNDFTLKLIQNLTQLSNYKDHNATLNSINPLITGNFSLPSNNDIEDGGLFTMHNLYKSANNTLNNFIHNNIMHSANSFNILTNNIQPIHDKLKQPIEEEIDMQFKLDEDALGPYVFNQDSRNTTKSFFKIKNSDIECEQPKVYDEKDINQINILNNFCGYVNSNIQNNFEKFKDFCDTQQSKSGKERTSSISPKREFNTTSESAFNMNGFK